MTEYRERRELDDWYNRIVYRVIKGKAWKVLQRGGSVAKAALVA